jgi:hypothetical protein
LFTESENKEKEYKQICEGKWKKIGIVIIHWLTNRGCLNRRYYPEALAGNTWIATSVTQLPVWVEAAAVMGQLPLFDRQYIPFFL